MYSVRRIVSRTGEEEGEIQRRKLLKSEDVSSRRDSEKIAGLYGALLDFGRIDLHSVSVGTVVRSTCLSCSLTCLFTAYELITQLAWKQSELLLLVTAESLIAAATASVNTEYGVP